MRRVVVTAGTFALALSVVAAHARPAPPAPTTLTVFAAASLSESFGELGTRFERAHPGTRVRFSFAGSQTLAAQLAQGAVADVFAAADERWMQDAVSRGRIAGPPAPFAHNRLVVIVPATDPGRVRDLAGLARGGLKLVIAADAVPAGHYARQMLANLSRQPGFATDYAQRVLANVVSEEDNVKAVLGKVRLGEADGGIVYRSDVTGAVARYVRALDVPAAANVVAAYPVAVVRDAPHADAARAFVAFVLAPEGQAVLARYGFEPLIPAATP